MLRCIKEQTQPDSQWLPAKRLLDKYHEYEDERIGPQFFGIKKLTSSRWSRVAVILTSWSLIQPDFLLCQHGSAIR
ncbi:hypothetical protein N9L68_05580 [bacterium]|nr:hypothetical protein [bacterium]